MSTFVANLAAFDAMANDAALFNDDGSETITYPAKRAGDGVKRSARLSAPAGSDNPADGHAAAALPVAYSRTARMGAADRVSKRLLTGAAALTAVDAMTGFSAPAPRAGKRNPSKRAGGSKRSAKRAAAALPNRGGVDAALNGSGV